jgi:hypothetical protein
MKVLMICNKCADLYDELILNYTEDEEHAVIDHKQQPTLLTSICRSLVRRPSL